MSDDIMECASCGWPLTEEDKQPYCKLCWDEMKETEQ